MHACDCCGYRTLAERGEQAADLDHHEVVRRLRDAGAPYGMRLEDAHLELFARRFQDERYFVRHPLHALGWLLRHSQPRTLRRRWSELRTGTVRLAG